MPVHNTTLPDIEQSVARPVIYRVIEQLFEIIGISKDTKILYAGSTGSVMTPGTSIDENDNKDARFATDRYTFVEVSEEYSTPSLQETHVHSYDNRPVFLDSGLGVSLRPIYITSDVSISIRYQSVSETEVRRWMASMFQKVSMGREIKLHDVTYTYPLPYPFVELLEDIWALREAVEPYGDIFRDYVVKHSSNRLTMLGNRAGEMRHLAIKETQSRIQGYFDFSGMPEKPSKERGSGTWEIAFTYKFSYQRPEGMMVAYPISVHNQFLPVKYLEFKPENDDVQERNSYQSYGYHALGMFENDTEMDVISPRHGVIRIPDFDDFTATEPYMGAATALTALCFLEDDKKILLDLKDLGEYALDQDLIEYLKAEAPYLTRQYQSLVTLTAYSGEVPIDETKIEVTSDLIVQSKEVLDLRKVYHVRMSLMVDVHSVHWPALERLSHYPKAFVKIVAAINELLRNNDDFLRIYEKTRIDPWELTYVYWILSGCVRAPVSDYSYTDTINYPTFRGDSGNRFIGSIDRRTVENYQRKKRSAGLTVQSTAIIARLT